MIKYNYRGFTVHQCGHDVWVTCRGRLVATTEDTWEAEEVIDAMLVTGEPHRELWPR